MTFCTKKGATRIWVRCTIYCRGVSDAFSVISSYHLLYFAINTQSNTHPPPAFLFFGLSSNHRCRNKVILSAVEADVVCHNESWYQFEYGLQTWAVMDTIGGDLIRLFGWWGVTFIRLFGWSAADWSWLASHKWIHAGMSYSPNNGGAPNAVVGTPGAEGRFHMCLLNPGAPQPQALKPSLARQGSCTSSSAAFASICTFSGCCVSLHALGGAGYKTTSFIG